MTRANAIRFGKTKSPALQQLELPDRGSLHLGIDIGSVSCKLALLDDGLSIRYLRYQRTHGRPMETARAMLATLLEQIPSVRIATMAGTGTAGRALCGLLGIDFVNELICQAAAIGHLRPEVRTLIEMGGQDSKVIFLPDRPIGHSVPDICHSERSEESQFQNVAVESFKSVPPINADMSDFSMNTVCAAGTGSFLDQQATRLGVDIEGEFGELAIKSENPPRVAGRCSVFAKSDMIHLQQQATPMYEIIAGLCLGLARS